ncbi:MAG: transporter substrate-binding domain-containing protein [Alphaproteobacteria bacterium]
MKNSLWFTVLVAALVSGLVHMLWPSNGQTHAEETAFARVMRTGTLRCGYINWAPGVVKDPNTGQLSGLFYDYALALGKELAVKVDFVEEVGWGNFQEGLNAKRYDVLCSGLWQSGQRAVGAMLTQPIAYQDMKAWARQTETRFDNADFNIANTAQVKFVTIDGDITSAVRKTHFPAAGEVALPPLMADSAQMLDHVTTRKADMAFTDSYVAGQYNLNNPDKLLKPVFGGKPLVTFANVFAVRHGEHDLLAALNSTMNALDLQGVRTRVVQPYVPAYTPEPTAKP